VVCAAYRTGFYRRARRRPRERRRHEPRRHEDRDASAIVVADTSLPAVAILERSDSDRELGAVQVELDHAFADPDALAVDGHAAADDKIDGSHDVSPSTSCHMTKMIESPESHGQTGLVWDDLPRERSTNYPP
jgi:hypothetical protein